MLNKITHIRCLILRLNSILSKAIHLKDLYRLLIKTYMDWTFILLRQTRKVTCRNNQVSTITVL